MSNHSYRKAAASGCVSTQPVNLAHSRYSIKYFRNSQEESDSLLPDVNIEPSIEAFAKGRDPVMDWVLQQASPAPLIPP